LFIVKKNGREATCKLRSHQFGWELLLLIGRQTEIVQSQVTGRVPQTEGCGMSTGLSPAWLPHRLLCRAFGH
jgi:hypothetical protein